MILLGRTKEVSIATNRLLDFFVDQLCRTFENEDWIEVLLQLGIV